MNQDEPELRWARRYLSIYKKAGILDHQKIVQPPLILLSIELTQPLGFFT